MSDSQDTAGPPRLYTAGEAALILKTTANWMKEQARKRQIPFTMVGGGYRWTDAHLDEIIQMGEHRPELRVLTPRVPARRAQAADAAVPLLQARTPRRRRTAA